MKTICSYCISHLEQLFAYGSFHVKSTQKKSSKWYENGFGTGVGLGDM